MAQVQQNLKKRARSIDDDDDKNEAKRRSQAVWARRVAPNPPLIIDEAAPVVLDQGPVVFKRVMEQRQLMAQAPPVVTAVVVAEEQKQFDDVDEGKLVAKKVRAKKDREEELKTATNCEINNENTNGLILAMKGLPNFIYAAAYLHVIRFQQLLTKSDLDLLIAKHTSKFGELCEEEIRKRPMIILAQGSTGSLANEKKFVEKLGLNLQQRGYSAKIVCLDRSYLIAEPGDYSTAQIENRELKAYKRTLEVLILALEVGIPIDVNSLYVGCVPQMLFAARERLVELELEVSVWDDREGGGSENAALRAQIQDLKREIVKLEWNRGPYGRLCNCVIQNEVRGCLRLKATCPDRNKGRHTNHGRMHEALRVDMVAQMKQLEARLRAVTDAELKQQLRAGKNLSVDLCGLPFVIDGSSQIGKTTSIQKCAGYSNEELPVGNMVSNTASVKGYNGCGIFRDIVFFDTRGIDENRG